jgi:hypothetical protein
MHDKETMLPISNMWVNAPVVLGMSSQNKKGMGQNRLLVQDSSSSNQGYTTVAPDLKRACSDTKDITLLACNKTSSQAYIKLNML